MSAIPAQPNSPAIERSCASFDAGAFGRSLVDQGVLRDVDWKTASAVASQSGQTPLRALLDLGLMSEDDLARAVARSMGAAVWEIKDERGVVSDAIPRAFQQSSGVLAIEPPTDDAPPTLVIADPSDRFTVRGALSRMRAGSPGGVELRIGTHRDVQAFLAADAGGDESPEQREGGELMDVAGELSHLRDMASEAPVIRLFNQTIERAMDLGASDVHFERFDHRTSLRVRVDGMLIEQPPPPSASFDALLCRIKIMAGLDIAERRLAQDGRIRMRLRGRSVDLRVSLVPTMYGQDAAIRIQDRQRLGDIALSDLGYEPSQIDWLKRTAARSHGILLITGPTGSGKTTTLYALLRTLVGGERKIVTVEDPVEYAMEGVNQIQVNPAIGLMFGSTLRHILRHDPDTILIGEIRDSETAQMAFQSALTGHMVLSTLHTNSAPGAYVRLIDMGVEPYLVNAAVEGVTAQRLLRKRCAVCGNDPDKRGRCEPCRGLGYRGRVAVMEHASPTAQVKRVIARDDADERMVREALERSGFEPMRAVAQRLVGAGITDEAEVVRVLGLSDPESPA
ncbi:MAG: type II/IV secretion system protein [Phycisphaeraceae bacterium]|nr:type II/IV secretion system protein [Phycisphaeraceae bacterium]MCB9847938.1 type II/IV secretion system protein [Phycisphaeraceae bacterium]